MYRFVYASAAAFAASAAMAQAGDPLRSADCHRALDVLQAQEEAAAAALPPPGGQPAGRKRLGANAPLETVRRRAAGACLGARADAPVPPLPQHLAQPAIVVAPVAMPRPLPPLPPSAAAAVALPRRVGPPTTVTACDAVACWASDGSRLPRTGAGLIGPRGLCSGVPGALLQCP
jgi:hypothetical protein